MRSHGCLGKQGRRSRRTGRGSATVELAVCLPVMVLLVFGSIELCRQLYARESLYIAAYEVARAAARKGGNENQARQVGQRLLESRGFSDAQISIQPPAVQQIPPGTEIRVRVELTRRDFSAFWKDRPLPAAEVYFVKE
jgi:Flp pilus assembly protein TadG